jgi:hypothetical protein
MSNEPIAAIGLQPSEVQLLAAASRIDSAHVASGQLPQDSEASTMESRIHLAIKMALRIDQLLQSHDEALGLGFRNSR